MNKETTSYENKNENQIRNQLFGFPENLTFEDFLQLDDDIREEIISRNLILQTDTYNRSMNEYKGERWADQETYVLQLRRASAGYSIASGIRRHVQNVVKMPITQSQLNFAKEFYANYANVPFFNEDMWQSVVDNGGNLPLEIDAVPDGTAVLAGDPIMRVTGPGELAAHIEPEMHRVFYESLVATTAHEIATKIGADRFIEVGKRGTPNEAMHLQAAVAMFGGGGLSLTSNDAVAASYPENFRDVGTMGHRFVQFYDSELDAFEQAINKTDTVSLLIDLTDSFRGIDMALELKEKYRNTGKAISIRLDSGDIMAQTLYVLEEFKKRGFTDHDLDKLIIEDLSNVDQMVEMDEKIRAAGFDPERFVAYGAGGLLVTKEKERSKISTGYKLAEVMNSTRDGEIESKLKFSDSAGKESLPGQPTLIQTEAGRVVAQVEEIIGEDLFVPVYRDGELLLDRGLEQVREQVTKTFAQIKHMIGQKTPKSEATQQMTDNLAEHYDVNF